MVKAASSVKKSVLRKPFIFRFFFLLIPDSLPWTAVFSIRKSWFIFGFDWIEENGEGKVGEAEEGGAGESWEGEIRQGELFSSLVLLLIVVFLKSEWKKN